MYVNFKLKKIEYKDKENDSNRDFKRSKYDEDEIENRWENFYIKGGISRGYGDNDEDGSYRAIIIKLNYSDSWSCMQIGDDENRDYIGN